MRVSSAESTRFPLGATPSASVRARECDEVADGDDRRRPGRSRRHRQHEQAGGFQFAPGARIGTERSAVQDRLGGGGDGPFHADGREDLLFERPVEALAGKGFDDPPGDGEARIRVVQQFARCEQGACSGQRIDVRLHGIGAEFNGGHQRVRIDAVGVID